MIGTFKISIPDKYVISAPDQNGNETNIYFSKLADIYTSNIIKRGWKVWNSDGRIHAEIMELTVDEFGILLSLEGAVEWFNPFIKVPEALIDAEILEGLSNRTYQVQTGIDPITEEPIYEDKIHTWKTWRDDSHPLADPIEGFYYFMSATFGRTLSTKELEIIYKNGTVFLVDSVPEVIDNIVIV